MNEKIVEKARTLLLCAIMVTAALMPMLSGATDEQLRDQESLKYTISTSGDVYLDEGGYAEYEICVEETPDGVLIITPSSDNSNVVIEPAYLKFTKLHSSDWYGNCEYFGVEVSEDNDASDTTATISHSMSGTTTVFSNVTISDIMVSAYDMDSDIDGDDIPDDLDDDMDGDGVNNTDDAFPEDSTDSEDADGDGVGDNADTDDDNDGVNDTDDWAPMDDSEQYDTDGDGVGDNSDVFPDDANETEDTDGDGVGDNSDTFPSDGNESIDTDGDGVGDNGDTDADNDTVLDVDEDSNSTLDCQLLVDCDGDGFDDADDAFDLDPEAWDDLDGDGLADSFPNLLVVTDIGCEVSVTSSDDDSDDDTEEDAECTFTLPAGGSMTLYLQTGSWASETGAKLTQPDGTQLVWSHGQFSNDQLYNLGTFTDAGDYIVHMYDSYGDGCNPNAAGCFLLADAGTTMAMPSSSGCLLYTSPSPRDRQKSRMPSSA